ncbi:MAG: hypothetical protein ACK44H_10595, partial [Candidatus Kryptonium sp.]
MRKIFSVVFILFLSFAGANSQDRLYGGIGYFNVGVNFLNFEKLNQVLSGKNRAEFKNVLFATGGGGFAILGNFMIGGEGFGFIAQKQDKGNYRSVLSGGAGFFKVGYVAYQTNNLLIYPMLGLGGGGLDLKTFERKTSDFEGGISNPSAFNANFSAFIVDISGGVDFIPRHWVLGLRVGYLFSPIV